MRTSREVAIYLRAVNKMDAGFDSASGTISRFTKSANRMIRDTAIVFGAAFTAMSAFAISTGLAFEQAMANTSSMFIASAESAKQLDGWMEALAGTARALGSSTAFTATEAANAMYSLASGGLNAKEVMEATESVLHLAGATMTGMVEAAELLMSTLRQFNLEAMESRRVANVFAAAIQSSMLNMERLHFAMQYTGPVAARLGMTIEETAASLALLHNAGLKGSLAGTGMRQVMIRLTRPSSELARVLKGTTVSVDGFAAVIQKLSEANLRPDQVARMFGQRTLAAITSLLAAGKEGFTQMREQITGTDAAAKAYERQMNTVRSQLIILKSAFQETGIAVYEMIRPSFMAAVKEAQKVVHALRPELVKLYGNLVALGQQAWPVVVMAMEAAVNGFQELWKTARPVREALGNLLGFIGDNLGTMVKFAAALAMGAWAVGVLEGALVGLRATWLLLQKDWKMLAATAMMAAFAFAAIKVVEASGSLRMAFLKLQLGLKEAALDFEIGFKRMVYWPTWFITMSVNALAVGAIALIGVFVESLMAGYNLVKMAWDYVFNPFSSNQFNWEAMYAELSLKAIEMVERYSGAVMGAYETLMPEHEAALKKLLGLDDVDGQYDELANQAGGQIQKLKKELAAEMEAGKWEFEWPDLPDFKADFKIDLEDGFVGFGNVLGAELDFAYDSWKGFLQDVEGMYYESWDTIWDTTRTGSEKWKAIYQDVFSSLGTMLLKRLGEVIWTEGLVIKWQAMSAEATVAGNKARTASVMEEAAAVVQAEGQKFSARMGGMAMQATMTAATIAYQQISNMATQQEISNAFKEAAAVIAAEGIKTSAIVGGYATQLTIQAAAILASKAEGDQARKTAAEKFFAAHAGLPFVGWAMAAAAVVSMIALLSKMHDGGMVGGRGSRKETARILQEGEFVMPVAQTEQFYPILEQMRNGEAPTFSAVGVGGGSAPTTIVANVSVGAGSLLLADDKRAIRRLSETIADDIDKRVSNRRVQ